MQPIWKLIEHAVETLAWHSHHSAQLRVAPTIHVAKCSLAVAQKFWVAAPVLVAVTPLHSCSHHLPLFASRNA